MVDQPELSNAQLRLVEMMLRHEVRFMVIGGMAVRAHGLVRATRDIDLWLSPLRVDADRLGEIFSQLTSQTAGYWAERIFKPGVVMPYTAPHKEADILTSIKGADFEAAYARAEACSFGGLLVPVVCLEDLIHLKTISAASNDAQEAKTRDRGDLAALQRLRGEEGA